MREHIQQLELKIRDLESTDHRHSPSVTLFDPHAPSPYLSESSSSSGHDSPRPYAMSASASPVPFPLGQSTSTPLLSIATDLNVDADTPAWEDQWSSMTVRISEGASRRGTRSTLSSPEFTAVQISDSFAADDPPFELAQML